MTDGKQWQVKGSHEAKVSASEKDSRISNPSSRSEQPSTYQVDTKDHLWQGKPVDTVAPFVPNKFKVVEGNQHVNDLTPLSRADNQLSTTIPVHPSAQNDAEKTLAIPRKAVAAKKDELEITPK